MHGLVDKINHWLGTEVPRLNLDNRHLQASDPPDGVWRLIRTVFFHRFRRYTVQLRVLNGGRTTLEITGNQAQLPSQLRSELQRLRFIAIDAQDLPVDLGQTKLNDDQAGVICVTSLEGLKQGVRLHVVLQPPGATLIRDLNRWLSSPDVRQSAAEQALGTTIMIDEVPVEVALCADATYAMLLLTVRTGSLPLEVTSVLRQHEFVAIESTRLRAAGLMDDSDRSLTVRYRLSATGAWPARLLPRMME